MREWQRSHVPTECRYGSRFSTRPRSSAQAIDARVGLGLVEPLEPLGDHPAVGPDHGQRLEAVVAADVEVHRVVTRRHLDRARAERRVDALVGDDRHAALDHRDDHLPADRVA